MAFKDLQFQGQWREYQKRILDNLDLRQKSIHIVAAPGSGKTVLGLEIMRRLEQPCLIITPTIAIRNQWLERLSHMYLPFPHGIPPWASKNIKKPNTLTVTTYQALHALESLDNLCHSTFQTVILDEAHHLRKEWWKTLEQLRQTLANPTIVSLTATPPYDVDATEWKRYEAICGLIDYEISVPELVKCGDLCPHQDYVYFSLPSKKETSRIKTFKRQTVDIVENVKKSHDIINLIGNHPWIIHPASHEEAILNDPSFFSSMLIFLHSSGQKVPANTLTLLGIKYASIPPLNLEWFECLLTGLLFTYKEDFINHKSILDPLHETLKKIGAIERKKVILNNPKEIQKLLTSSISKLQSILAIVRLESKKQTDNLRMVILADYIRKAQLPTQKNETIAFEKLGVIPIFEWLRKENLNHIKLGVLTGTIIIIPQEATSSLESTALKMHIQKEHIRYTPLIHDDRYCLVSIQGEQKQKVVHLITEIFNKGDITALVGTQALLGEGWDAPSINTLILASYVGSYMLSNQMRGRAIRIDPQVPNKTSNIWHLVTLDLEQPFDMITEEWGGDFKQFIRRFKAFEGVSYAQPLVIENGFRRLNLPLKRWDNATVNTLNESMFSRAKERNALYSLWKEALQGGSPRPDLHDFVESNYAPKGLSLTDTLKYMIVNALLWGSAAGMSTLKALSSNNFALVLKFAFIIAGIAALPKLLKAAYLFIRNGTIENSIKQVGWAVLETLQHMDVIKTSRKNIKVVTLKDPKGIVYCRLEGGTSFEKNQFLSAIQEILNPIVNPRYLLVRRSYLCRLFQVDYHNVPTLIGKHAKNAEFFAQCWKRYVGYAELVFTRNHAGRRMLLKARSSALSSHFLKKTDRLNIWQ